MVQPVTFAAVTALVASSTSTTKLPHEARHAYWRPSGVSRPKVVPGGLGHRVKGFEGSFWYSVLAAADPPGSGLPRTPEAVRGGQDFLGPLGTAAAPGHAVANRPRRIKPLGHSKTVAESAKSDPTSRRFREVAGVPQPQPTRVCPFGQRAAIGRPDYEQVEEER